MQKSTNLSLMIALIGLAIILAAGLFLAVSAIQNRPEGQEEAGTETVTVEGQQITLKRNPETAVRLVDPLELLGNEAQVEGAEGAEPAPSNDVSQDQGGQPEQAAAPEPTATAVPPVKVIRIDYLIQQGDTLFSIAQRVDTSIALMAEYEIASDNLVPGRTIQLPVGNPAYCTDGRRPYAVGEGDTAFSIGKKFNIDAVQLQTINNLDENYTVKVADILCVP